MKFRKVLCGSIAALMAMSTTAIVAQAEETEQVKLVTVSTSEVCGEDYFNIDFGDHCFADSKNNIYMLDENALKDWQKTGKANFIKLTCDTDLSGMTYWSGSFDEGYVQLAKRDSNNNVTERKVLHLDKASGAVKLAYTLPANWCYTNPDGYTMSFVKMAEKTVDVIVYNPSGAKTAKTFTYNGDGNAWYNGGTSYGGDFLGYFMFLTNRYTSGDFDTYDYEIYTIKKNGEVERTYKSKSPIGNCGWCNGFKNGFMWLAGNPPMILPSYIYSAEENKVYEVKRELYKFEGDRSSWNLTSSGCESLYGTKAVIKGNYIENKVSKTGYALVDISKTDSEDCLLSNRYSRMSTNDGELYCVQTEDGKWGFIDSSGKELAMFDDAVAFDGEYTPVVKDGKGYIIDCNMNKVSNEVDADYVMDNFGNGLFAFILDGKETFVTFAAAETKPDDTSSSEPTSSEPTSSEPVSSEPTSSESTSSEPTSSEPTSSEPTSSEPTSSAPASSDTASSGTTGGNDNPNSGAAMALVPVALIGGAAVVVSKKRKR